MRRVLVIAVVLEMSLAGLTMAGVAPIGSEFQMNIHTTSRQTASAVAMNPGGGFVVVWRSDNQDGDNRGVFGRMFDSGGVPAAPEFQVTTYTTGNQNLPTVAVGTGGEFVVIWQSYGQDGSGHGLFGQLFDSSGGPMGTGFRAFRGESAAASVPSLPA